MNMLAVDDNKFALHSLEADLKAARPNDTIYGFLLPGQALEFVNNSCDALFAAFLDVEMPGMSGIELAAKIKMKFPRAIIIFVSAYPNYSLDAFKVRANGYLVKPITEEMLKRELDEITQPFISVSKGRIRAHTFGNFDLYVDDVPVKFARTKSKEIVAYLIDRRGAICTMNELSAILFEDDANSKQQHSYIRNLIDDIKTTLTKLNASHIIRKEHNGLAINADEIDCDYYRMLNGEPTAINQFFGEYLSNYGWAEFTAGELGNMKRK